MTIKHTQSELANNRVHDKDSRLQASVKFIESIMIQNDNDMHAVLKKIKAFHMQSSSSMKKERETILYDCTVIKLLLTFNFIGYNTMSELIGL